MADRQANDSIKGYFYQFNKTIIEILTSNDDDNIYIEGIEDIDIENKEKYDAIQCKYYSKKEYNHSEIKPAIIMMIEHFAVNQEKNLNYKIYANFKGGQSKLPDKLTIDFFKKNFLTYKRQNIIHKVYDELNLDDNVIEKFISKIYIDINADDYDTLEINIKNMLKKELKCNDELSELYFIKAGSIIKDFAIKETVKERVITKKKFFNLLLSINIILDKWYISKVGKEKYCKLIRKKYFSKQNISPYERFFIVDCTRAKQITLLKQLTIKISEKWSKLSRRAPTPFCPYIIYVKLNDEMLLNLKQALYDDNFKFIDGFDFKGAKLSINSIIQQANYKNGIRIKILELNELNNVLKNLKLTKEIYQFYTKDIMYENEDITNIKIKIEELNDIFDII